MNENLPIQVYPADLRAHPRKVAVLPDRYRTWFTEDDGHWVSVPGYEPMVVCASYLYDLPWPARWTDEEEA